MKDVSFCARLNNKFPVEDQAKIYRFWNEQGWKLAQSSTQTDKEGKMVLERTRDPEVKGLNHLHGPMKVHI